MSLGVLNNLSAVYAENNLNSTNNSLNTVLQQLSSGSKINSGADDAAGLSLVDGLQANQSALMQSQTNAQEGVGLLQVADGALSQVTSLLNRAVTLATEASNGTLNASQDTAANQEYQSILSEINNIGTTTTYNDTSVFGQASTNIYTGDSSSAGSSIDSLNIRSLSSSNVGDSTGVMSYTNGSSNVFIDLSSGGDNASLTDSLGASTATTTVNLGYMTTGANGSAVSATSAISVGAGTNYQNTAQGLISAINNSGLGLNATFSTAAQAGSAAVATALASKAGGGSAADTGIEITATGIGANGTGSNGAGVVGSIAALGGGQTLGGTLTIVGSDGNTHNLTLGTANSTDTLANLASTVNAAQYGVTATVNTGTGALQFTTANSNVTVSASGLTENTAATDNTPIQVAGSVVGTITVANAADTFSGGTLTIDEGVDGLGTAQTAITLGVNTGVAATSTDTMAHLLAYMNANTATTGITASLNGSDIGTVGQAGYQAANTVLTLTKTAGDLGTPTVTAAGMTDGTAAVVNSTTLAVAAPANGSLGSLTIAASGDMVSGSATAISITDGAGNAHNISLTTPQNFTTLAGTINGDAYGVEAVVSTDGKTMTFYETGTNADKPIVTSGANITDTTPLTTGTPVYTASAANGALGSGTGALGSLTVQNNTDVLNGTLNIKQPNATTVALALTNKTLAQILQTVNNTAAYGITASLNTAGTVLSFTATSGDAANPLISNSGNITDTTPSVATDLTMADVPTPGVAPSTQLGTLALAGNATLSGSISLGSNTITIGATDNTAATLASTISKGDYGVTATYANGTMTFSSPNSAMTIGLGSLDSAVGNAAPGAVGALSGPAVTSSAYYSLGISSAVGITDTSTGGGTTNVGMTTDSNGTTGIATISYSDGTGSNLSATDLSNQNDAQAALNNLNSAITAVAAQDGYIGAQINTLNSVSSVLSTQQENVESAQNAVQATDYASAASNMSKYEILSQTGISALAQANSMQQEVTKLLQ